MGIRNSLPFRNLVRRPGRTTLLLILVTFLSLSIFGGTIITASLASGLASLEARLGADVMVVPYEAATKTSLENIVLQGNTGYFYMDRSKLDKISALEGVGQVSAQIYLASTSSGCCSLPVQIIGIDPETDFTIQPWLRRSYGRDLEDLDVVVGNDLNAFVGDDLSFYDVDVHVAGKLDKTGTYMDTAVFCNFNTIRAMINASLEKNMNTFADIDPDQVISCVMVNAAEGYTVDDVLTAVKIKVKGIRAVQTKSMISGISQSLLGVTDVIRLMIVLVWILALAIMILAFMLIIGERKKEFAILRVVGASRSRLGGIVLKEALMVSLLGGLIGVALGLVIVLPFGSMIENMLNLPFLIPGPGRLALLAVVSLAASAAAGCLSSVMAARKAGSVDPGQVLREGN